MLGSNVNKMQPGGVWKPIPADGDLDDLRREFEMMSLSTSQHLQGLRDELGRVTNWLNDYVETYTPKINEHVEILNEHDNRMNGMEGVMQEWEMRLDNELIEMSKRIGSIETRMDVDSEVYILLAVKNLLKMARKVKAK
ncbi:hypothetical protein QAD02_005180 [Eretmocerus hayati]|uniref:Uncharacterized protein n=1 Tax=Eretmocerus hayati TaxID=131215 RepID=A0ACC2NST3_9HYME|nr:hypothetical protein QAD02_005180 [Eretmocerus hayati]